MHLDLEINHDSELAPMKGVPEIRSAWLPLVAEKVASAPVCTGVFEIADPAGAVLYIGRAGGKDTFGLRGVIARVADRPSDLDLRFRVEISTQYMSRWRELTMAYGWRHGHAPPWHTANEASGWPVDGSDTPHIGQDA